MAVYYGEYVVCFVTKQQNTKSFFLRHAEVLGYRKAVITLNGREVKSLNKIPEILTKRDILKIQPFGWGSSFIHTKKEE